eukprot:6454886-Amphidinium_carterae.1
MNNCNSVRQRALLTLKALLSVPARLINILCVAAGARCCFWGTLGCCCINNCTGKCNFKRLLQSFLLSFCQCLQQKQDVEYRLPSSTGSTQ